MNDTVWTIGFIYLCLGFLLPPMVDPLSIHLRKVFMTAPFNKRAFYHMWLHTVIATWFWIFSYLTVIIIKCLPKKRIVDHPNIDDNNRNKK